MAGSWPEPTLLVLDLGLHILDRVRGLDFQRDSLPCQGFYLHACMEDVTVVGFESDPGK